MPGRLAAAAIVTAALWLVAPARADEPHSVPSWMKAEPATKRVRLDIVAGFNANNNALNYNGYFTGDLTLVVPVGWTVEINFKNNDAMLPHSLIVTKPFAPDHFPDQAGLNDVAIPRAYTDNPEQGIPSPKTDKVTFVAKDLGDYYLFCGAPGHGLGGMWVKLRIENADTPYAVIAPGAESGRP